jgi:hypothetical protein
MVSAFVKSSPVPASNISFVDSSVQTMELKTDWNIDDVIPRGGVFLDWALQSALVRNYLSGESSFPIFVVVSPNLSSAITEDSLAELSFTFPETDKYWHLDRAAGRACSLCVIFRAITARPQGIPRL